MIEIDLTEYDYKEWEDDDRMYRLKASLNTLRPVEKKIFLTYTELGTYTETAKYFKVSVPTIRKYITQIRAKILEYDDDNTNADYNGNNGTDI